MGRGLIGIQAEVSCLMSRGFYCAALSVCKCLALNLQLVLQFSLEKMTVFHACMLKCQGGLKLDCSLTVTITPVIKKKFRQARTQLSSQKMSMRSNVQAQ